jgi:TrmH family RNA methyltransferase
VLAGAGTADFYNPKTVRSMAGSMWDLTLHQSSDLPSELGRLKAAGFDIVGTDLSGESLTDWSPSEKVVLVLGSEAHGMSDAVRATTDRSIRIEGGKKVAAGTESLNVAVAAAIVMYRMRD